MSKKNHQEILILDLSRLLPGPLCSYFLSEVGFRVIKCEDKNFPDYLKDFPPFIEKNMGLYSFALNHAKEKLVLDFKNPATQKYFRQMTQCTDVLIESFRPGKISGLGFTISELRKLNPKLIIASITGYGQTGPNKNRAGHDLNYMAESGQLYGQSLPRQTLPQVQWADTVGGGLLGAFAIQKALMDRLITKKGCHLDIAMADGMSFFAFMPWLRAQSPNTEDILGGVLARYGIYETKDGQRVVLAALEAKFWNRFCSVIGKNQWQDTASQQYLDRSPELHRKLKKIFLGKTKQAWLDLLEPEDICFSEIKSPRQLLDSAQFRARKHYKKIRRQGREWVLPSLPIHFASRPQVRKPLHEVFGMTQKTWKTLTGQ